MSRPVLSQETPDNQLPPTEKDGLMAESAPQPSTKSASSRLSDFLKTFTSNRKALGGLIIIGIFLLIAIFGPIFLHQDPNAFSSDALQPPSSAHWLGTTNLGQDVFTQVIDGTRASILWGLATALIATFFSVVIGIATGYLEGVVADVLVMVINVFLVLPGLPLIVLVVAYSPVRGPLTVALVLAFTNWAFQARVLRAQTLSLKARDFVAAARASGESTWKILFWEILPNEIAIVVSGFIGTLIYVIGAAAGVEFLGLSDVTTIDWGTILFWAQNNSALLQGAWWWFAAPGICLAGLGAGLVLLNFSIDEIADPRLRSEIHRKPRIKRWSLIPVGKAQPAP